MKIMNLILGFSLMIGIASYSTALEKSDYDREVDFAHFKTFDWKAQPDKAGNNPYTQNTLLEKRIHIAVGKELAVNGHGRYGHRGHGRYGHNSHGR